MIAIRTVLCPVDFSPATTRQLELAVDVCRAFGARLVLHHNLTDVSPGAGVSWMWHADHVPEASAAVDDQLRAVMRQVPDAVPLETCITRGAVTEAVLSVGDAAEADLVILTAHEGKAEDHASVIEFLLEHSNRPVLALHDPHGEMLPRFTATRHEMQTVLVPANPGSEAHPQIEFACDLARTVPVKLHLLDVIEPRRAGTADADPVTVTRRVEKLVPADLVPRTTVHVETGDAVAAISQWADRLRASLIVMGEHTRVPVKRWLTRDTSRAVLHRVHCPVWYVPATRAAAALSLTRFAVSSEKSILWGNV
jgi:nucleotide-binding universal stress UspA family protein